ncbi:MAG: FecR domain-containing protein [Burkholderiaceae bacterium]|nr:FecR domain-containing protein [Burkholderiaceae bacterium]
MPANRDGSAAETRIRQEAIAWYARLCSGEATDADRMAWQRWLESHPEHQRAWRPFDAMQAMLQRVPGHLASSTLQASRHGRRRVLRGMAALVGSGTVAGLSWQLAGRQEGMRSWLADYRTGTGERRDLMLADGSALTLNTGTSVDVSMDAAQRRIVLHGGEILVRTARSAGARDGRPFTVHTPQGRILALGTRFTVRSEGEQTVVSVLQDAVQIQTRQDAGHSLRLQAGQQAVFSGQRLGAPMPADPAQVSWVEGSLVVDGWRLEDVVRELARYRPGRLACDPAVAELRVSGVFPLADTDRALAVIARAFPVRAAGMTRYWVTLVPA